MVAVGFESLVGGVGVGGTVGEVELLEAAGCFIPVPGGGGACRPGSEYGNELVALEVEVCGAGSAIVAEAVFDAVEFEVQACKPFDVAEVVVVLVGQLGDLLVEVGEFVLPPSDVAGHCLQGQLGVDNLVVAAASAERSVVALERLARAVERGPGGGEASGDVASLVPESLEFVGEVRLEADAGEGVDEVSLAVEQGS